MGERVRREEMLLHRPATELVSEGTLAGMERDGWTPTQVRALIASYRLLARDGNPAQRKLTRRRAFRLVENELRELSVSEVTLYVEGALVIQRLPRGKDLATESEKSLLDAVDIIWEGGWQRV